MDVAERLAYLTKGCVDVVRHELRKKLERSARTGKPLTVIATGGVAALFVGATDKIDHFDGDLTIRGMLEIWRRNAGKPR